MIKSAVISGCGQYRYRLDRRWSDGTICCFVMLNPSTADADLDDPTIRRCISFAKREGHGALTVVNLFPYRATKPVDLWSKPDFVRCGEPEGIAWFWDAVFKATTVIAAWGAVECDRAVTVKNHLTAMGAVCLGKTKDGHPRHPLYVHSDAPLVPL